MKFILFLFFVSSISFAKVNNKIVEHLKENKRTVILSANFDGFTLSPLVSESSQNFFINNLYYETPLRYSPNGELISRVLKEFTVENGNIVFELGDYKYMDGSKMSPKDIAMTVMRSALRAPKFPLDHLKGYHKWSMLPFPLESDLEGIAIEGNKITFSFDRPLESPFQWATDSSLGITKHDFINTKTGNLTRVPPASGPFTLSKRSYPILRMTGKYDLYLVHININDLPEYTKYMQSNHLVFADSGYILPDTYDKLKNDKNIEEFSQQQNRFSALLLDANKPPFNEKRVRQFFAREFRETIKSLNIEPQGSLMTELSFGFVPLEKLCAGVDAFSDIEKAKIIEYLRKNPPIPSPRTYDTCALFLEKTVKRLGIPLKHKGQTPEESNMACIFSGLDMTHPVEEFTAFLSLGRFKMIDDYSDDIMLKNLVDKMAVKSPKTIEKVNEYMFKESFLSGLTHNQITHFITKDSKVKKLVNRMTSLEDYFD